jgi:Ni,Fe-hydrogenase III component G
MTPELRNGLYSIDPLELGASEIEECIKPSDVDDKCSEIVVDENILKEMMTVLGFNEIGSRKSLIATKNEGFNQAMEYYLQYVNDPLFNVTVNTDTSEETKKKKKKPRVIPIELQRLFTNLQFLDQKSISTQG